jgi:hypothetical protein
VTANQSVARLLAAVDALGGSEWSEADQIRYVRTFLEEGIDALARAEEARFDFLADCAMLASHNMQDARLHVTDERLAKLENPDGDATAGGFFVELGVILALELVVVATATYAVPALIGFAAAAARTRALRRLTDPLSQSVEGAVTQRQAASESLKKLRDAIADKEAELLRVGRDHPWYHAPVTDAVQALRQAEHDYRVGEVAHASETLLKAVSAVLDAAAGAVPPNLTSAGLQKMLDGTLANATVGRVAEQVATDDVVRKLLAATPEAASAAPALFQTSTLVGRFLEDNARARADAAREWAAMRFHIRVLPDASLVASDIAQKLLWAVIADPPPPGGPGPGPGSADAEMIVRGMEVVLWLAWMRQTQALGQRFVSEVPVPGLGGYAGGVRGDVFIASLRLADGTQVPVGKRSPLPGLAHGFRYPGLLALADGHAQYLYGQFAREFFVRVPGECPAPLEFDAARYDSVDALPDGQERTDRIAEMKLLTIVFFQTLEADPTKVGSGAHPLVDEARETLRTLLDVGKEQDTFAEFLASQPKTSEPDAPLPYETTLLDPVQEVLVALVAERVARDDAVKLATMVTDLDLLISQAPSGPVDDAEAGLVERFAAEDLRQRIQDQQAAVEVQYDTFLEHAAGQTELVDDVNAAYEARIRLLVEWPPPARQFPSPTP